MSPALLAIEAECRILRQAVEAEDFTGAQKAAESYVKLLDAALSRIEPQASARCLSEARDLLEWARRNLRASRARLAGDKARLLQAMRYRASDGMQKHRVRLDA